MTTVVAYSKPPISLSPTGNQQHSKTNKSAQKIAYIQIGIDLMLEAGHPVLSINDN
jgi:hypothetical protein